MAGASAIVARGAEQDARAAPSACGRRWWRAGITRADHVVALGGGVVGDLAGFCAATYQRGIPVVQVPTTLVAQVDSAYGGKTGVDLPEAKNYVGAYHQPAACSSTLTRSRRSRASELAAGWVEVLKTALIAGGRLWESVSGGRRGGRADRSSRALARSSRSSARTSATAGRRQVLNLGHTVGHAIETVTGYGRYRHGEAVGLGLLAALALSGQDGLREQVRELLLARGLPVTLDATPPPMRPRRAGARQEAPGDRGAVRAGGRARRGGLRRELPAADVRAAVAGAARMSGRALPRRGHARRQPRPARTPRPAAVRHAHAGRAGAADRCRGRGSWAWTPTSSTPTTRASSSSACTRCAAARRRRAPEPRSVDALRLGDPRRAGDRRPARPSRSTSPMSSRASRGEGSR